MAKTKLLSIAVPLALGLALIGSFALGVQEEEQKETTKLKLTANISTAKESLEELNSTIELTAEKLTKVKGELAQLNEQLASTEGFIQ